MQKKCAIAHSVILENEASASLAKRELCFKNDVTRRYAERGVEIETYLQFILLLFTQRIKANQS